MFLVHYDISCSIWFLMQLLELQQVWPWYDLCFGGNKGQTKSLSREGRLRPLFFIRIYSYFKVKTNGLMLCLVAQLCPSLCDPIRDSPGKNTGVGCHALLQGIFPTQGLDPGSEPRSPMFQADFLPAEPPGKINVNMSYLISASS